VFSEGVNLILGDGLHASLLIQWGLAGAIAGLVAGIAWWAIVPKGSAVQDSVATDAL
jgi:hypothetical protein